jgi:uncharacterized membrane protein (DUF106 family)
MGPGEIAILAQIVSPIVATAVIIGVLRTRTDRMARDVEESSKSIQRMGEALASAKVASTAHAAKVDAMLERDREEIAEMRGLAREMLETQAQSGVRAADVQNRLSDIARRVEGLERKQGVQP